MGKLVKGIQGELANLGVKKEEPKTQDSKNWGKLGFLEKVESGAARAVEVAARITDIATFGVFDTLLGVMGTNIDKIKEERVAAETEYLQKKGYAGGGIAIGPDSGYMEKLHGTEAVVPLEGGRSIPVSLQMTDLLPKSLASFLANYKQEATDTKQLISKERPQDYDSSSIIASINNLTSTLNTAKSADYSAVTPLESGRSKAATIDFSGLTTAVSAEFAKKYTETQAKTTGTLPNVTLDTIPKAFKTTADSDLIKLVKEQTNILVEIKSTLDSSKDLQQQYVYNSYS